MNILAFAHGLKFAGAQISTLEFFELLGNEVNLRTVVGKNAKKEFLEHLRSFDIEYRLVPCSITSGVPIMSNDLAEDWLRWSEVVWITDEFLVAPKIKKIRNVPVVAHLRTYSFLCHSWSLMYGIREMCYEGCSVSRIVRCKQLINRELASLGIIKAMKSNFYQVLDLVKGPLDYFEWRRVINKEINSIDGFIAVSNFVKRVHEELLPTEDKPIEVVYNPITYPLKYAQNIKTTEDQERNLIIYASGSDPLKGPHIILEALKLLLNENLDVKLIMFNCKGTWVEKYARRLGVEKYVIFTKRVSFDELYKKISMANVVVMPSLWPEPFGRVAVEANRLGAIAVVMKRGGLPETIIHGETGFLAEVCPEDLAEKIKLSIKLKRPREIVRKASLSKINPRSSLDALLKFFETL